MNKNLILIAAAIAAFFLLSQKKDEDLPLSKDADENEPQNLPKTMYTEEKIKAALKKVYDTVKAASGAQLARAMTEAVEKIYRLETAHFKSGQFKASLSPGMMIAGNNPEKNGQFPYGWGSLNDFIRDYAPDKKAAFGEPVKFYVPKQKKNFYYVRFPDLETAMGFLAFRLEQKGRPGGWYSTDPELQNQYEQKLKGIKARYTDLIY